MKFKTAMKKLAIVFAAVAVMFTAASCEKENRIDEKKAQNENLAAEVETVDFAFTAIRDAENDPSQAPSRATVSDNHVLWEVGDQIFLFAVKGTSQYKIALSEALTAEDLISGGASATFHFLIENPSSQYNLVTSTADYFFASYPYRALTPEEDAAEVPGYYTVSPANNLFTYTMLAEQSNSTVQCAYAKTADRSFTLSFQNVNTLLKFKTENKLATKAVLTRNDSGILGYTRVNVNYNTGSMGYNTYWLVDSKISAITSITKTVEAGDNYFAVWPNITMTGGFTITLYDDSDDEVQSFVYASNYKPTRNYITTIANFDSRSTMAVKPKLKNGEAFNAAVKNMAAQANGGETGKTYSSMDLYVTDFAVSTSDSGSYSEGVGCTKVSADDSVFDIWATISGGTVTLRTAADGIKMAANSSRLLYNFDGYTSAAFLSSLDMTLVTDATAMFANCAKLETVPAITFNRSTQFGSVFAQCTKLSSVGIITGTDVRNVSNMFLGCSSLTSIEFSDSFDTYNCTNYQYVFSGCTALTSIVMKGFHLGVTSVPSGQMATILNAAMHQVHDCTVYYSALPDGTYTGTNCYTIENRLAYYGSSTSNITWNTGRP